MTDFRAIRIDKDDHGQHADYVVMRERDLMEGDVDVDVAFSAINYKDGLAVTGDGPVVRRFPMIPGVDLAGRVTRSAHPDFASGDIVVATACGLGEAHFGGFAEKARLSGDWLAKLPPPLTPARAMAVGTAGLTAMFCVLALERHGARPQDGLAVVTGAAGGVGSFAVALLASGQNSTITGTLAGQIVMEGFLNIRLPAWIRRLITRLVAIVPAVIVTAVSGERGVGQLLILSQVVLSMQLTFAVVPLVQFTGEKGKMGVFANPRWLQVLSWSVAALIGLLNAWLLVAIFRTWL